MIKKASFTVWCVDIDDIFGGTYTLSDTLLKQVPAKI